MDISKIAQKAQSVIASLKKAPTIPTTKLTAAKQVDPKTYEKVQNAIANQAKAKLKLQGTKPAAGKFLTPAESSISTHGFEKKLAYESATKGKTQPAFGFKNATPEQAVYGAKVVSAATGEFAGKSAQESAQVFEQQGLSQFERKLNLSEKYGDRLKEKHQRAADIKEKFASWNKIDEILDNKQLAKVENKNIKPIVKVFDISKQIQKL